MLMFNQPETASEYHELVNELEENPDFTYLGTYADKEELHEELNCYGFTNEEIEQMTKNRYGRCLELIEFFEDVFVAYIGER